MQAIHCTFLTRSKCLNASSFGFLGLGRSKEARLIGHAPTKGMCAPTGGRRFVVRQPPIVLVLVVVLVLETASWGGLDFADRSRTGLLSRRDWLKVASPKTTGTRPNLGGEPSRGRGIAWQLYRIVSRRLPSMAEDSAVLSDAPRVNCPVNKDARHISALGRSREPPACPEGFRRLPICRAATLSRGRGAAPLPPGDPGIKLAVPTRPCPPLHLTPSH
jgi:hypothetical protein